MSNANRSILFFALSLSLCVCAANAQSSGGGYQITQSVVAGGGGSSQDASGLFKLDGTIAEPLTGLTGAGPFSLRTGFWPAAVPTACSYSISPTSQNFGASGGTNFINVSTTAGCLWTAASNNSAFITITSGASGNGNGTVNYTVAVNNSSAQRTGTIAVAGQTFTVMQDGTVPPSAEVHRPRRNP